MKKSIVHISTVHVKRNKKNTHEFKEFSVPEILKHFEHILLKASESGIKIDMQPKTMMEAISSINKAMQFKPSDSFKTLALATKEEIEEFNNDSYLKEVEVKGLLKYDLIK